MLPLVRETGKDAFNVEADTADAKVTITVKMFRDFAKSKGWTFGDTNDISLIQYINLARSELCWTRKRTAIAIATKTTSGSEPTITDLKNARALATELKMDTSELLDLLGKLRQFGSLEKLEASLEALEELMGD